MKKNPSPSRQPTREEVVAMLLVLEAELPDVMESWRVLLHDIEAAWQSGGMSEDERDQRYPPIQVAVSELLKTRGFAEDNFHANKCFLYIGVVLDDRMGLRVPDRYAFLRSDTTADRTSSASTTKS